MISIDDVEILVVLVSDSGIVKNTIFRVEQKIPEDQLIIISNFLNNKLKGLTMQEIGKVMDNGIFKEMYDFKEIIDNIIPIINKSLERLTMLKFMLMGVTKIFNFPEYKDLDRAKSFISFIEDKELLVELLLGDNLNNGIEITIGNENIYEPIKDCSLITTTYRLGDMTIGKIGVIGPTRMDYFNVINALKLFSVNLTEILDMLIGKP